MSSPMVELRWRSHGHKVSPDNDQETTSSSKRQNGSSELPQTTQQCSEHCSKTNKRKRKFCQVLVWMKRPLFPLTVMGFGGTGYILATWHAPQIDNAFSFSTTTTTRSLTQTRNVSIPESILLPFQSNQESARPPAIFLPTSPLQDISPRALDFGGLHKLLIHQEEQGMPRFIHRDLEAERGRSADADQPPSEKGSFDYIFAFDDDYARNPYTLFDDPTLKDTKKCRRTNWHKRRPVDCNSMHEFDVLGETRTGRLDYLSFGHYRLVYLVQREQDDEEPLVFKQYNLDANYDHNDYEYHRMDALVAEMFSSSDLFVNSYGYCGLSSISEAMSEGTVEQVALPLQLERQTLTLQDETDVDPQNNLTVAQKLNFALDMAEALAMMHNYHGGVIVHDDVHLDQFLLTKDHQHVKIQDFNRAEIMLWNEKDQEYCRYYNGPGNGEWRSPEEYKDKPLNEKIDVWSLGTSMFCMLTGLKPFFDLTRQEVKEKFRKGKTPFIDPRYRTRSVAEGKLVEAIEQCWEYDADQRTDIAGVVEILRQGVNAL